MEKSLVSRIVLDISEDDMFCHLLLDFNENEIDEDSFLDEKDLFDFLEMNGITHGIKKYVLEKIIKQKKYKERICVAEGLPAVHGFDGFYDFKIDLKPDKKPKILKNGNVDYKNLNLFPSISKNQIIAEYIPKTEGIDGYDIKGNVLKAKLSKDLPPLKGNDIELDDEARVYIAKKNGKIDRLGQKIQISNLLTISGDIDLSTGNIDHNGDLEVFGSVSSGMSLKVDGNLIVRGTVESAHIEASGDVLVKGGIIGGNKAYIKAGGSVIAKFIERSHVIANDAVNAGSILSSYVFVDGEIVVEGRNGNIVGGKLQSTNLIKATNIGSLAEVKTEVEVGVDILIFDRQIFLMDEIEKHQMEIERIEEIIEKLEATASDDVDEIKHKLIRTKIERLASLNRNRLELEEILEKINLATNARIEVEAGIYPGVVIRIDSLKMPILKEEKRVVFFRKGEQIYLGREQK